METRRYNKFFFYLKGLALPFLPGGNYSEKIKDLEAKLSPEQKLAAEKRIRYYCKSTVNARNAEHIISELKKPVTPKAYYFDTYEYARYFPENQPIDFVFGDVTTVPERPSIVKSRPIIRGNENSVLLNLDRARHFVFVRDDQDFTSKKSLLIGRGAVFQQHRYDFYEKYFANPLCDLGQVNKIGGNPMWIKPKISIAEHLACKFILSLEGNDVATNLKWIMSSHSIAVMPKPKYETWFMEGQLVGGVHFIEMKDDYSDLEEKLRFYLAHPEKCLEIIKNANEFCAQFFNKNMEDYCSLRVLERYLI